VAIRSRHRKTRLLVVVLVSLSLAMITLDYRQGQAGPLAGLGRGAAAAMVPLQRAVTSLIRPIEDFFSALAHLPTLADENQRLKDRIADLETARAGDEQYRHLYEQLLALLDLQQLNPGSVAASVIANGVSNFEWTVTIDAGSADGLAVDMPVVAGTAESPRLVGHVVRVTDHSADVQLIIDRRSAVAAVLDVSRQVGLIEGQGEDDLRMELLPPSTEIAGGEAVFTQGYEINDQPGLYPPGILIGTVSRVVPSDNELEAFVDVQPAVDFSDLRFVLVLKVPRSNR